jgi:transposase
MTRLRTLARSVSDAGTGDLGRMLAYKARWYGCDLVVLTAVGSSSPATPLTAGHADPVDV